MLKPLALAHVLLLSSALVSPPALAQSGAQSGEGAPAAPAAEAAPSEDDAPVEEVQVSIPGADIVVTGRRNANIQQNAPQVVNLLSTADIKRTGEGDIAGSLQRVTGLSVVGNGYVYVRGLGDRYSLALLNGSPLPSPEPLKRVVPLDIFPTSVIASTLVQKSFSVNYPGEFGGGVINLTTRSIPTEGFLSLNLGVGADTETTLNRGYTYFGSRTDWTGFDNGTRDVPPAFKAALAKGVPLVDGANFTAEELRTVAKSLVNAPTTLVQENLDIPVNWSGGVSMGESFDLGSDRLGVTLSAGISNKWRTRETRQQTVGTINLDTIVRDFLRDITDYRIVVNGLLGFGYEFGEHELRSTSVYIRDTLKQARLGLGRDDITNPDFDIMQQATAWYERQLIDTQLVGEFKFGPFDLDVRGSYANSQREAPYERTFKYVRTNDATDPTGNYFVNDLGGRLQGEAIISFSNLNEDLWAAAWDGSYEVMPDFTIGTGYSFSDTNRTSQRRDFRFDRPDGGIGALSIMRPDYLTSDLTIDTAGINFEEFNTQDGQSNFNAGLRVHGAYLRGQATPWQQVSLDFGVRYERGFQTVTGLDLSGTPLANAQFNTRLKNEYLLPAFTATVDVADRMQVRANVSRTIARPQFRELINQIYFDPDSNREFNGNASLKDSTLWNGEIRYEWYFAREQRLTAALFYKKIDKPIETFVSLFGNNDIRTSFANAPSATLYGVELEAQKYIDMANILSGPFFSTRRITLIGNYTYTKSEVKVGAGDTTIVNGTTQSAASFFRDGSALTGQSDHLVNLQLGLEDTDKLSQQTLLLTYSSPRVTARAPVFGQPDVEERPGLRLDFVARQGLKLWRTEAEFKLEARNLTGREYVESQKSDGYEVFYNRYDQGTTVTASITLNF
jgi:TonB-dependent receptor